MTDWTEASADTSTWSEASVNTPKAGHQPAVAGDEWDELWTAGYDFTPWARASSDIEETTWTENS